MNMSYSANRGIEYCVQPPSLASSPCGYMPRASLESKVTMHHSEVSETPNTPNMVFYRPSTHQNTGSYITGLYLDNTAISQSYAFSTDDFLSPSRPRQRFVGEFDKGLREMVERTFMLATGQPFPDDITINVCDEKGMARAHPGWNPGIMGFALNRKSSGQVSEVFVLNTELDRLLLTLGHEIGHVMSKPLSNSFDEEAKAFAFSIAWMDTIVKHNIGSLSESINIHDRPAPNGLHDVAFNFVKRQLQQGNHAMKVFSELAAKRVSVLSWMMS